ncbi:MULTISPECIES: hypothetical protein [unclassified Streptomyces]|uniref:hypothetical protein n=1 Tax=unclassified Streptomyces TaxID=2593676 RepID=UPI00339F2FB7
MGILGAADVVVTTTTAAYSRVARLNPLSQILNDRAGQFSYIRRRALKSSLSS